MNPTTSLYGPCDLCVNPWPFMCSECACEVDDGVSTVEVAPAVHAKVGAVARAARIWIGSGEDFLPA